MSVVVRDQVHGSGFWEKVTFKFLGNWRAGYSMNQSGFDVVADGFVDVHDGPATVS